MHVKNDNPNWVKRRPIMRESREIYYSRCDKRSTCLQNNSLTVRRHYASTFHKWIIHPPIVDNWFNFSIPLQTYSNCELWRLFHQHFKLCSEEKTHKHVHPRKTRVNFWYTQIIICGTICKDFILVKGLGPVITRLAKL